ncbi:hypothetical protein EXIGLDRAFT_295347 [Exidia glandulosa HHB12029]|uniref:Uncharacterized protein n=1 Tax=Exidia glandulosa HHB12029 TaxID=1314781 RepID=A0A165DD46_EXIGL|nr:hypothetical protein EXIGLDRAFT_295347 [Exidia glandulosa HHB12029]
MPRFNPSSSMISIIVFGILALLGLGIGLLVWCVRSRSNTIDEEAVAGPDERSPLLTSPPPPPPPITPPATPILPPRREQPVTPHPNNLDRPLPIHRADTTVVLLNHSKSNTDRSGLLGSGWQVAAINNQPVRHHRALDRARERLYFEHTVEGRYIEFFEPIQEA